MATDCEEEEPFVLYDQALSKEKSLGAQQNIQIWFFEMWNQRSEVFEVLYPRSIRISAYSSTLTQVDMAKTFGPTTKNPETKSPLPYSAFDDEVASHLKVFLVHTVQEFLNMLQPAAEIEFTL
jgi:hypothetical protein